LYIWLPNRQPTVLLPLFPLGGPQTLSWNITIMAKHLTQPEIKPKEGVLSHCQQTHRFFQTYSGPLTYELNPFQRAGRNSRLFSP
jgi:hypothetical protein